MGEVDSKELTAQDIRSFNSGRVILRDGKKRLVVYKPIKLYECDLCKSRHRDKMCKWARAGGHTILVPCPECAAIEVNCREMA